MSVQLLHGDCLDLLPTLPAQSVDLVLSDWPYGTTACAWDSVIPLDRLWPEIKRVLKPRGAVVLTASQPFTTTLISSNMDWFRYCWVWDKVNRVTGFLDAKRRPLRVTEDICVFYQQQPTYNPQMTQGTPYNAATRGLSKTQVYGKQRRVGYVCEGQRYPKNIIAIPANNGPKIHPTQKPLALFEYLMRTYSNPGEVVLDNAFGSCTTGEAAIRLQRAFIGMEKEAPYFAIGAARCAAAQAAYQPALLEVR